EGPVRPQPTSGSLFRIVFKTLVQLGITGMSGLLRPHHFPIRLIIPHLISQKRIHKPTFKGSECPCRFLVLRTLHTTRRRDRAHHRPTGDKVGPQRSACPLDPLSRTGPGLCVQTRPPPPLPSGLRSGLCCLGAAGHAYAGTDGPGAGSRCRRASPVPSASLTRQSVRASPATRGRSPQES